MNLPHWEQTRRGEFRANIIPDGQCGFTVGQDIFEYEATICVRELDENNWILDNRDLDRLFDAWREGLWQASCEQLAGGALCNILDTVGNRADEISVTIGPNSHAALKVIWRRGDARPCCPRRVDTTVAAASA